MKYLMIFIAVFAFGFDVFFDDYYQKTVFPNQKAILLETNKSFKVNYSPKLYTSKGIVLLNYNNADDFVRNDLYLPNGVNAKNVEVGILDINKIRDKIITRLDKHYKKCKLKKIIFKDNDSEKKVFFKPTTVVIHSQVVLDCP